MPSRPFAAFIVSFCLLSCGGLMAAPFINEFHAENIGPVLSAANTVVGTEDLDGNSPDWIEIRNPDGVSVNLTGWALSNDPAVPGKWVFPSGTTIAANGYLLVFASGKNGNLLVSGTTRQLHTNFRLPNSGSVLLSQPAGPAWNVIHQIGTPEAPYPPQKARFSYGYSGTTGPTGTLGYIERQTPRIEGSSALPTGAANQATISGFVGDTSFSVDRGLYDSPQSVVITAPTEGASIIYTTNGSEPTDVNGTKVTAPAGTTPSVTVPISVTTCLRARATKPGMGSSNVDTQTYIFPAHVLGQNESYVTLPYANWGHDKGDANTVQAEPGEADWEMDPIVTGHSNPEDRCVADDLKEIPSISLVLNWTEMFGPGGIYIAGENSERRASFEVINPRGSKTAPNLVKGKQEGGTVHIFGGSSTSRWKTDKLSMRFKFWSQLSSDIFGDAAAGEYNTLVLDARLNQVWTHSQDGTQRNRGDYVRDAVMSDLENAMGNVGTHGQHVHLYINGLYWGLYTLHERPDEHFAAAYYGGDRDEYDVVKHNPTHANYLVSGARVDPSQAISNANFTAGVNYQNLLNLAALDLTVQSNYNLIAAKLDIPHFINYMLLNFYGANTDWAHQNWYASYNRIRPNGKWRFHSWDAEHVFKTATDNATDRNDPGGPTGIHQRLAQNSEYRRIFGDAAHKLLFNEGVFTPNRAKAIFDARLMNINEAIRAESARWGDNGPQNITSPSNERHLRFSDVAGGYLSWWTERNRILTTILDGGTNRTTSLVSQLRSRGWYPALNAPVFSQHGGIVPANYNLTMTHSNVAGSAIYYMPDGSDPRAPFTIAPRAGSLQYTAAITLPASKIMRARVFNTNTSTWSALNEAFFSVGTVPASAANLVISKIHYRPAAPTAAEIAAGFNDRSDFEFIEVLNISNNRVNLDSLSFSSGLDIAAISDGVRELEPGGRALYVANKSAFELRYGTGLPIAGEFVLGSNLANNGETLTLVAANGATIVTVTYANTSPWPTKPDGFGPALVLMQPATSNPNLASSWRISTGSGGSPGVDDRFYFAAWQTAQFPGGGPNAGPLGDPDADGLANLVEFGLGTNPNAPTPASAAPSVTTAVLDLGAGPQTFLVFSIRRLKAAEELSWAAEAAVALPAWSAAPEAVVPIGNPVDHGDGTETRFYRGANSIEAGGALFFRAKVSGQ